MNSIGVRRVGLMRVCSHSKVTGSLAFGCSIWFPSPRFLPPSVSLYLNLGTKAESHCCCYLRWGSFNDGKYGSTSPGLDPGAGDFRDGGRSIRGHWLVMVWKLPPLLFLRQEGGCVAPWLVSLLSFSPSSSFSNDSGRKPETKANQAFQPLIQSWGNSSKGGQPLGYQRRVWPTLEFPFAIII